MKRLIYILTIGVLCSSCSETATQTDGEAEYGSAHMTASASAAVDAFTRSTAELPAELVPAAAAFSLHITGSYQDETGAAQSFDQRWASTSELETFTSRRGQYKAAVLSGDMESEGAGKPCFAGETDFTLLARKTIDVTVNATLQNAAFRIAFDDWFTKYYSEVQITIRTESGHSFLFAASDAEPIFVKPATKLFMSGTAIKSQTGAAVEFPETQIGVSQARTLHTITLGASKAGASGLEIRLDDTFTPVEEQVVELNPDAVSVK